MTVVAFVILENRRVVLVGEVEAQALVDRVYNLVDGRTGFLRKMLVDFDFVHQILEHLDFFVRIDASFRTRLLRLFKWLVCLARGLDCLFESG